MRKRGKDLSASIVMILDRAGPLSTGEICDRLSILMHESLTDVRLVQHGRSRNILHGPHWEVCPKCDCTEEVVVPRQYMAPRVRAALKKLTRLGLAVEIPTETPNNRGGHLWLRADQATEYYQQVFV
jgi:hypothetical protein